MIAAVDAYIEGRQADLVEFVQELVRFGTVSIDLSPGSDHRRNEEKPLQEAVGDHLLQRLGAEIDRWEPDASALRDHPMMPPWHHWEDRPITVGVLRGTEQGRSLIINGHIDVVDPGDPERWSSAPFAAKARDGRVYGRGAVDMKGGIAAALFAIEALVASGIRLAGDLTFEAVTDVEGVRVGHSTIVRGEGPLVVGEGPVRTNVTVVCLREDLAQDNPVFAGCHRLNGNGEMTGLEWIRESGVLATPVAITNTHSVGVVRDTLIALELEERTNEDIYWCLPVVAETYDGTLNDINGQHVGAEHVREALSDARGGSVGRRLGRRGDGQRA